MRNKGFSLVELSVVLVVIGIILLFIMRGSNLTVTAREFHDISMLNKLRSTFSTAYGRTHQYPEHVQNGANYYYEMDYFYDNKLLTEKELESKIVKDAQWALVMCSDDITTTDTYTFYDLESENSDYVCAVTVHNGIININRRLVCLIERDLDDKDTRTGFGRTTSAVSDTYDYEDCRSYPTSVGAGTNALPYAFRIF